MITEPIDWTLPSTLDEVLVAYEYRESIGVPKPVNDAVGELDRQFASVSERLVEAANYLARRAGKVADDASHSYVTFNSLGEIQGAALDVDRLVIQREQIRASRAIVIHYAETAVAA